jgi:dTDP-4-dehydrorhamnose reductase
MTNKREEFNLITIYGDEIMIITDLESIDAVYTEILDDLDANNLYHVGGNGESAIFKGHELSVIDFKKVIGRD